MAIKPTLYWINSENGIRLAIVQRPRGWSYLDDDLSALKNAGIENIVSLLPADEAAMLGIPDEEAACEHAGLGFFSLPIPDGCVPDRDDRFMHMITMLKSILINGGSVGIHCRAGIGRSCLVAACLMQTTGMAADTALTAIEKARGCKVPDTPEQRSWILQFS